MEQQILINVFEFWFCLQLINSLCNFFQLIVSKSPGGHANVLCVLFSPNVSVTWPNPLAEMNITWTKDLVTDLRRRMDNAKTFVPACFQVCSSKPVDFIKQVLLY